LRVRILWWEIRAPLQLECKAKDASYWQEIERARRTPGGQKMSGSLRLFEEAAGRMLAGIKAQFPGISDEQARRIRSARIDLLRRIEPKLLPP
jgi:hypothetical protein